MKSSNLKTPVWDRRSLCEVVDRMSLDLLFMEYSCFLLYRANVYVS